MSNVASLASIDSEIKFHVVKGEYCLTAEQIAKGLEYGDYRAVLKLCRKHKDELNEYQTVVDSATVTGNRDTTVFTEEGIYLICMFARTPKAKEFRKRVAGILKALRQQRVVELEGRVKKLEAKPSRRSLKAPQKDLNHLALENTSLKLELQALRQRQIPTLKETPPSLYQSGDFIFRGYKCGDLELTGKEVHDALGTDAWPKVMALIRYISGMNIQGVTPAEEPFALKVEILEMLYGKEGRALTC